MELDLGHFLVFTSGFSGSTWLSAALDLHPDILCAHGKNFAPARVELSNKSDEAWCQDACSDAMLRRWEKKQEFFAARTIDDVFDILEQVEKAEYYGNIHMYTCHAYMKYCQQDPPHRRIQVAQMQRHPVKILESAVGRHWMYANPNNPLIAGYEKRISSVIRAYGLEPDDKTAAFIEQCRNLYSFFQAMKVPGLLQIPFEKVVRDRDFLCYVIRRLTSSKIDISREYLQQVDAIGVLARHSPNAIKRTPEDIFTQWDWWKKDYFARTLLAYESVFSVARELGYDFQRFVQIARDHGCLVHQQPTQRPYSEQGILS